MKKKINLTDWDWITLVAAWRYYEHGHTIVSATFPGDIIERFWGARNPYTDEVRTRIATQFAVTDHGLRGEADWKSFMDGKPSWFDTDYKAWTTFYQFCRGWVRGYATVVASNGKRTETIKAFYTEFNKRWTPVDGYIASPTNPPFIPNEYIKSVKTTAKEGDHE